MVCFILFQSFSSIFYSFHLLRNRNGFIKRKDVCFIISFRFTLFRNEHISNFLVCFILFQSFSSITYSFHLFGNRNGFIKKKKKMYVSSFYFVSPCFVTRIFQIFWSVSSCFRVFPLYLIHFVCYKTEMGLYIKNVCFIVSFRFTLFRNEHISNFLVCFILFQSFSYISYSFHLLRNRNGFIFQKRCMFHRFILFHL